MRSLINKKRFNRLGPLASKKLFIARCLGVSFIIFWILTVFTPLSFPFVAEAATRTWDGEGVDNNWSTCANWSSNTCPVSGDTVTFDSTSTKDSTIDGAAPASIAVININSGYTGTITLGRTQTISSSFNQHAGTYTASSQTLDMNGSFTLDGGNFTASSTFTTLAGAMSISGSPGFNANSGLFTFDGSSGVTLSCGGVSFNLVSFANTSNTKTVSSNCTLPTVASPTFNSGGNISLSGTLTGSGTLTTANTFTINSSGTLTGYSGLAVSNLVIDTKNLNLSSYSSFTASSGATVTLQNSATLTVPNGADFNGSLTLNSSSTFNAPSGTMTLASSLTINSGTTFNANGGTLTFDGNGGTLNCDNTVFNLVTFSKSGSSNVTINSTCNMPLGNNPSPAFGTGGSTTNLNGTLSGTGTITISSEFNLNSTGSFSGFTGLATAGRPFSIVGASADFGNYTTFDINNTFTLSSGADFTAPSGTMTVASHFTLDSGTTFHANGGTLSFDAGNNANIACNNQTFNLVTFANTGNTKTVGSDCNLPLGNNPSATSGGNITLNGTLSGSGALTTGGTLTINSTGVLSGFSGITTNTFTIDTASLNLGSYTTVDINGTFTLQNSASFTAPSGTATFASNFNLNAGTTFTANGGTVTFDGTGSGTPNITCNNTVFNLVIFNHSNRPTVASDCTLPLGNNPQIGSSTSTTANLTLNGSLTGTGLVSIPNNSFTLTLNAGGNFTGFDGLDNDGSLTINGTYNFGNYTTFRTRQNFTLGATGVLTAPAGTMRVGKNFTLNGGSTFTANGGTLEFFDSGASSTYTLSCNNATFNLVTFTDANTSTTRVVSSDCSLPLGNNPTATASGTLRLIGELSGSGALTTTGTLQLNSGYNLSGFSGLITNNLVADGSTASFSGYNTLDINNNFILQNNASFTSTSATMTVGGNWTVGSGSTFNHNNGSVVLDGGNQTLSGSTSFYNLTKTVASAATLTMPASSTTTVVNNVVLKGTSGELLSIVSSSPPTQWLFDIQGEQDLAFVAVSDSNATGTTALPCDSQDDGGNTNWTFNPGNCHGGGGDSGNSQAAAGVINFILFQVGTVTTSLSQVLPAITERSQQIQSQLANYLREIAGDSGAWVVILIVLAIIALLIMLISLFIWLFMMWRRRQNAKEDGFAELLQPVEEQNLQSVNVSAAPGSVIHPNTTPKSSQFTTEDFNSNYRGNDHNNQNLGGQ